MDADVREAVASDRREIKAGLAMVALAVGTLVYVFDRSPGTTYFLSPFHAQVSGAIGMFGTFGGVLPDFLHVFAFSLLTAAVLRASLRAELAGCFTWWSIDTLFECGQHAAVSPYLVAAIPAWFDGIPFLENTAPYFARGTFDVADLLAITLGALAAAAVLAGLHRQPEDRRHV